MVYNIGIKVANGEFYPILEEGSSIKKRLILTTVHDNQKSVQIDLYRSALSSMEDATYIGSLVVENLFDKPKGEPSIELTIGTDGESEIDAEAVDLDDSGSEGKQFLTVSLQALDQSATYDIPEFELEEDGQHLPPDRLYEPPDHREEAKKNRLPLFLAGGLLLLALLLLLLWLLVFNKPKPKSMLGMPLTGQEEAPPPVVEAPPVVESPPQVEAPTKAEPVAEQAPIKKADPPAPTTSSQTTRTRPPAPVSSYKVPAIIPKDGFRYKISWGDTLWDISDAFYKNAWLYPRIARHNKIQNPDLIISGTWLLVPPK